MLDSIQTRDSALQLRRCSTSVAQNYAACTVARSHADFVSKLRISLEEADEAARWLRMLQAAELVSGDESEVLAAEALELAAIFGASCRTAEKNPAHRRRRQ